MPTAGMSRFEEVILEHMETVPPEYTQAVDAIRRELYLKGYDFWFFHLRLKRMVRKGLIRKGPPICSIWPSYDGTPTYGRAKAG